MATLPIYILNPGLTTHQLKDAIAERIQKLQALASVCHAEDFIEFTLDNLTGYFWMQSSLLAELSELFTVLNKQFLTEAAA